MDLRQTMKVYTLLLLSMMQHLQHVRTDAMDDLMRICPYTDSCTVSGIRSNITASDNLGSCCMDCYCDDECWKYNDCCIDVPHSRQASQPQTQCRYSLVKNRAYYQLSERTLSKRFPAYRMIDSCPSSFTGSQLTKDKCMEAFTGVPNYDDVVMVSNKDRHDEIYKNKHCASCNGVQDIIKWNLHASFCKEQFGSLSSVAASVAVKRTWDYCIFFSTASTTLQFSRKLLDCGSHTTTSTCEATHEGVNPQWKHFCEEGPYALVYFLRPFRPKVYKNPFCLLCDNVEEQYHNVCNATAFSHSSRVDSHNALSMLLDGASNYDKLTVSDLPDERRFCKEAEIFDHAKKRCRHLFCPLNLAAFYGQCLKLSKTLSNAKVYIKILFRPVSLTYATGEIAGYEEKDQAEFATSVLEMLKYTPCNTKDMSLNVYVQPWDGAIPFVTLEFAFALSDDCPLDSVTNNSRRIASKLIHIKVSINHRRIKLIGRLNFAERFDEANRVLSTSVYERYSLVFFRYPLQNPFVVQQVFVCPTIMINMAEYNTLMMVLDQPKYVLSTIKQTSLVKHGFYVMANQTIGVCTDTYFGFFKTGISSAHTHDRINMGNILVLVMLFHLKFKVS